MYYLRVNVKVLLVLLSKEAS